MSAIDWTACERLIGSLASKFLQDGLDLDDLKQEARITVLESYEDYSPEMGVSLNTFLGRRIRDTLRKYSARNLDIIEVNREWVAESIAEGSRSALRAKTREECELLCAVVGADRFKKPRRLVETTRATVSLDDSTSDAEDPLSFHELHGVNPGQEYCLLAGRRLTAAQEVELEAFRAGRHGGTDWAEMSDLRAAGWTFDRIGQKLGKSPQAVRQALLRAEKRLAKKFEAA